MIRFNDLVFLGFVCFIFFIIGCICGNEYTERYMERQAIQNKVATYNKEDGKFVYITKENND